MLYYKLSPLDREKAIVLKQVPNPDCCADPAFLCQNCLDLADELLGNRSVFNKVELLGRPKPEDLYEEEEEDENQKPAKPKREAVREPNFVTNDNGITIDKNDILGLPVMSYGNED